MRDPHVHPDAASGEEGSVSFLSLIVIFTFLLLLCTIVNTGSVVTRKLETQNAADAAANAATVEMARGMNDITAANHLMGELLALVVLHHALGGYQLDATFAAAPNLEKPWKPILLDELVKANLDAAYAEANDSPAVPNPAIYAAVSSDPRVGGAIGDGRIMLMKMLTNAYMVHSAGGALLDTVVFAPLGEALVAVATAFEDKVMQEWELLLVLEMEVARPLAPIKLAVQFFVIPSLYNYTREVFNQTPLKAEAAAVAVGAANGAVVTLFPSAAPPAGGPALALPVAPEPLVMLPDQSQLALAAVPWVKYWRMPVMVFGYATLTLSGFAPSYMAATDEFLEAKTAELKVLGVNLYVMQDRFTQASDRLLSNKGNEPWTTAQGSRRADQLFSLVAFARRDPAPVTKASVFRPTNPGGIVAYSQAMIYNANPQQPPAPLWPPSVNTITDLLYQPEVGWDTLNWQAQPGSGHGPPAPSLIGHIGTPVMVPQPKVCLNWQAKLVPTTRLSESAPYLSGGPMQTILDKLGTGKRTLDGTH